MSLADSADNELARVTILCRSFPPAYLRGGPGQTVAGLVASLGDEFRLSVITWAFDDPRQPPMDGVLCDRWTDVPGARIWFSSAQRPGLRQMAALIRDSGPQLLFLNSLLDFRFSIAPLMFARVSRSSDPVLLAPHGELSPGALALKPTKKKLFLACFKLMRLHTFVQWHATTSLEERDIRAVFGRGKSVRVHLAEPVRPAVDIDSSPPTRDIQPASPLPPGTGPSLSVVFLSRVAPKKNLEGLIRAFANVAGDARLTVAGPLEDTNYWTRCSRLIAAMPSGKVVEYVGAVRHDRVVSFLSGFDLFVLPTFGENFGHVVLEALTAGIPVVVGNDTPWSSIAESGAGWLCDPYDDGQLTAILERFALLNDAERDTMRAAARATATAFLTDERHRDANRAMLTAAMARRDST